MNKTAKDVYQDREITQYSANTERSAEINCIKLKALISRIFIIKEILKINISDYDLDSLTYNWEKLERHLEQLKMYSSI